MMTAISLITKSETTDDPELDALIASMMDDRRRCFGIWTSRFSNHELGECDCCGDRDECEAKVAEERIRAMPWKCFGGGPHEVDRTRGCGYQECGLSDDCKAVADLFFMVDPWIRAKFHDLARKEMPAELDPATLATPIDASAHVPESPLAPPAGICPAVTVSEKTTAHSVSALTTVVTEAVESSAPVSYRFPYDDPIVLDEIKRLDAIPTPQLIEYLRDISVKNGKYEPYSVIRPLVCATSLVLNGRRHCPPRFRQLRSLRKAPRGTVRDAEESMLSNDRQVIDVHWLWSTKQGRPTAKWRDLLKAERFNFLRTSEFVAVVGKRENKVKELKLTEWEMFQLTTIQTEAVRNTCRHVMVRADDVERNLEEWVEDRQSRIRQTVDELKAQFIAVSLAHGDHHRAAALYALMTQKETTAKDMQRRREKFIKLGLIRKLAA